MFQVTLSGLVVVPLVLAASLAVQVPPETLENPVWEDEDATVLSSGDHSEWILDKFPNPNATDHLVFETTYSLLQHWPNTRMRNGHTIVPGTIRKGTLLYHGTANKELPSGPEWTATDPEHAYYFCREHMVTLGGSQGCFLFTLAAARPLKVVYFDGSSAAKIPEGTLDTQDLLVWRKSCPVDVWEESRRAKDLCLWGKPFGVDGFVRMESDFEVILCDITSSTTVVSLANILRPEGVPPNMSEKVSFLGVETGSFHNHFPGETRIQLDLAGLVSFYDTDLVPSLVHLRVGQERWDHRVQNVSSVDLSAVVSRLKAALTRPFGQSGGVDWRTLIQVVVDRYAKRLELTRHLLNSSVTSPDVLFDLANKTQTQLRVMLTPYILFSATPTDPSDKEALDWAVPIYKLCSTMHTKPLEFEWESMTDSEKLLFRAVRETSREICRVVTKMWAAGVYTGLDPSLNTKESLDIEEVSRIWSGWAEDLNQLMAWLDWSVWVKCSPGCGHEEMCYLPTWPFGFPPLPSYIPFPGHPATYGGGPRRDKMMSRELRAVVMHRLAEQVQNTVETESDEWIRPQPKCIRRVGPYGF